MFVLCEIFKTNKIRESFSKNCFEIDRYTSTLKIKSNQNVCNRIEYDLVSTLECQTYFKYIE